MPGMSKFLFYTDFKYRASRHLFFFLTTVLLFTLFLFNQKHEHGLFQTFLMVLTNAFFFFGYAYITIFGLIPELLLKNRIFWFILLFALVGVGLSVIKLLFSDFIFYASLSPENIERTGHINLRFILVNTKDMSFIVALFCVAKYAKDYLRDDNLRRKLKSQYLEAQNKLLQAQFDSHFLFNTINNLYALSLLDPEKTLMVIARIKTMMSFIIDESQKKYVNINEELELLDNYIKLEQLRYGDRLEVEFIIEGDYTNVKIPPMVLFVLVENCFKHGSSLDAGKPWIKLLLTQKKGKVHFTTENSKPKGFKKGIASENNGSSLSNLKTRLGLLYGDDYFFHTKCLDDSFIAQLKIKSI